MCECILKTLGRPALIHKSESIPLSPSKQSTLLLFFAEKQSVVSRADIIRNFASENLSQSKASRQITDLITRSKKQSEALVKSCRLEQCLVGGVEDVVRGKQYQWLVPTDLAIIREAYQAKSFSRVLQLIPRPDDAFFAKDFETEVELDAVVINYIHTVRDELRNMWSEAAEQTVYQAYIMSDMDKVIAMTPSILSWELSFKVLDCFILALSQSKSEQECKQRYQNICNVVLQAHEIQLASFEESLKLAKENSL